LHERVVLELLLDEHGQAARGVLGGHDDHELVLHRLHAVDRLGGDRGVGARGVGVDLAAQAHDAVARVDVQVAAGEAVARGEAEGLGRELRIWLLGGEGERLAGRRRGGLGLAGHAQHVAHALHAGDGQRQLGGALAQLGAGRQAAQLDEAFVAGHDETGQALDLGEPLLDELRELQVEQPDVLEPDRLGRAARVGLHRVAHGGREVDLDGRGLREGQRRQQGEGRDEQGDGDLHGGRLRRCGAKSSPQSGGVTGAAPRLARGRVGPTASPAVLRQDGCGSRGIDAGATPTGCRVSGRAPPAAPLRGPLRLRSDRGRASALRSVPDAAPKECPAHREQQPQSLAGLPREAGPARRGRSRRRTGAEGRAAHHPTSAPRAGAPSSDEFTEKPRRRPLAREVEGLGLPPSRASLSQER
jgi:hypothetical protein